MPNGIAIKHHALTWLPDHLISRDKLDKAAILLGNGAFHLARLAASPDEATVRTTASETISLASRLGGEAQNLGEWRRFWLETEKPLKSGLTNAKRLGLQPTEIFIQMARDRFGSDAPTFRPIKEALSKAHPLTPCISRPCGFGEPLSLRSHGGGVVGLLALADGRLVSRGLEGAIRFWNQEGQSIQGDNPVAHPYGVGGMLGLKTGRLVSWGLEGAIRFWNQEGQSIQGGDPKAHPYGVEGTIGLENGRLVSWGLEGAIRFWSQEGQSIRGGATPPRIRKGPWACMAWRTGGW